MLRLLVLLAFGIFPMATPGAPFPLFDAHVHYSSDAWGKYSVPEALAILDRAGIGRALVSSTPDDGTLRLFEAAPERIVPELRPYRTAADIETWHSDPSILPYLEERLQRGIYRGIGEFHLSARQAATPVVRRVVELAVERGILLHAHSDEQAVAALFALDARVKILWAHAGMSTPVDTVGEMLDRHPNLWAELSYRWDEVAPGGRLDPAWRALFQRHPDRFLYGTDTWSPDRWPQVPAIANGVRAWLGELPPEVAAGIAFRNAERLFGLSAP